MSEKGTAMNWANEGKKPTGKGNKVPQKTAELVLEVLTCADIYIRSTAEYKKAMDQMVDREDRHTAKAAALAWERACLTSVDMLAKSLNDLCESDPTVANILRDRWGQTGEIISMSIPMLALMADMKQMNKKENNDE